MATVDKYGKVTLVGPGVTEIWIIFKGNDQFDSVAAMYRLTVEGESENPDIPDTPDAIDGVNSDVVSGGKWFDLNGRQFNGKPTKKGLYIKDGKKVLVK